MPTKLPSEGADAWAAEYAAAETPIRLVHSVPAVPLVDFTQAVELDDAQLLIVSTRDDCDRMRLVLPDLAVISWGEARMQVMLDPLFNRQGRQVFIWLPNDTIVDWIAGQLSQVDYAVRVIAWTGREDVDLVLCQDGSQIKVWVRDHLKAWEPLPEEMIDVIPDEPLHEVIEPDDVEDVAPPSEPEAMEEPLRPKARPKAIARAMHELEVSDRMSPDQRLTIDDWMRFGMHISQGKPTANVSNVSLLFDNMKPGEIWYDTFLQCVMTADGPDRPARQWTDADDIRLTIEVQRRFGMVKVGKGVVTDAVVEFAMRNCRNELVDYLEECGKKWDGVKRIANAFCLLFECKESQYTKRVSENFFKSMVRRALTPGSKVDTMIVLEGAQGIGKSSVLEALGGPYYAIMRDAPDSKDFAIVLAGKWLIEIAEMHAFSRADVSSVKRTLTTSSDRYRKPYGVHAEDHKRMSIFAGSVNRDDWNTDATGARRFWPIKCKTANVDFAKGLRDLYFGEALHAVRRGETHWEFGNEAEVRAEQDARYLEDDWTGTIRALLLGKTRVEAHQIYKALDIPEKDWSKSFQMRIADIMRRMDWRSKPTWIAEENRTKRMWCKIKDDVDE